MQQTISVGHFAAHTLGRAQEFCAVRAISARKMIGAI